MKKIALLVIPLLLLAACGQAAAPVAESPAQSGADSQTADQAATIADLENQVDSLNEQLALLQSDYDSLLASSSPGGDASSPYLCESRIDNMKYGSPASAIDILEGWFALQPDVAQVQGKYSTQFWQDVNSRIHTIRYISEESGLSETATFLIFFEEAGWRPGLLDMTNQCWLDYPD